MECRRVPGEGFLGTSRRPLRHYFELSVRGLGRMKLKGFIKALGGSGLGKQQKKTLKGQALAGDLAGAKKGLKRLMKRVAR